MYRRKCFYPQQRWWWLIAASVALSTGCGLQLLPPNNKPPDNKPALSEVATLTRNAARSYFREVAANYAQLSQEKFASVTAAMQRNVELDTQARAHYADALKAILQPRLSGAGADDQLSAQAAGTFAQMSLGFAEVGGKELVP